MLARLAFNHHVPHSRRSRNQFLDSARRALWLSAFCLSSTSGFSATLFWDGDGAGTVGGGTGTWDTTLTRWSTTVGGSTYQAWVNANNDDAVFGAFPTPPTTATVTIGSAITANSLTFNMTGYTLSGPTQVLSSPAGTLTVDVQTAATGTAIINALYGPTNGTIVKNGPGILSTGTNQTSFNGKWLVNAGTLSIPGDQRLGVTPTGASPIVPDLITLNGGFLRSTTASVTFDAKRGITLGAAGGGFDSANTTITWQGPVTGSSGGPLTKRGTFNLVLNNNTNNYDGVTQVQAGKLTVGSANALGTTSAGTEVTSGAELLFDGVATNFTISEPIQVAGGGAGDGGAITVQNNSNVNFSGPITLSGDSTLTVSGTGTVAYTNTNSITATNRTLTLQGGAPSTGGGGRIGGNINLGSGGLTKVQGGRWTLEGTNSYSGNTSVDAGLLIINGTISGTAQVNVTGTLAGDGVVVPASGGNVNLLVAGKLSPGPLGSTPGSLDINLSGGGKLDLTAGVTASNSQSLVFDLGTPSVGGADSVNLSGGTLEIGTGVLEFNDFSFTTQAGFTDGFDYVLFNGAVPISGSLGANLTGTVGGFTGEIQLADGGNDIVLHVVPEPSAVLALLGGSATLLGLRRRRA